MNRIYWPTAIAVSLVYLSTSPLPLEAQPGQQWLGPQLNSTQTPLVSYAPDNRRSAGRRTECNIASNNTNGDLYAIVPREPANSFEATPTLWFYVPYNTGTTPVPVRITVQSEGNSTPAYSKMISVSHTPGIIGVRLSQPLKSGVSYGWSFTVLCDGKNENASVQGTMQRTQVGSGIATQLNNPSLPLKQRLDLYKQNNIWFDRLSLLAPQVSKNAQAKLEWNALLKEIDFENLQSEPVQGLYTIK
jgi:hypothetical protein